MTALTPEACPMLLVECPLCDTPAPFDANLDTLHCPVCDVTLEMAAPEAIELAAAA